MTGLACAKSHPIESRSVGDDAMTTVVFVFEKCIKYHYKDRMYTPRHMCYTFTQISPPNSAYLRSEEHAGNESGASTQNLKHSSTQETRSQSKLCELARKSEFRSCPCSSLQIRAHLHFPHIFPATSLLLLIHNSSLAGPGLSTMSSRFPSDDSFVLAPIVPRRLVP